MKLNIGMPNCERMEGWTNLSPREGDRVDVVAEVTDLPFDDESVEEIRCCHVAEQLTPGELDRLAVECLRVLKPDGRLEVVSMAMDSLVAAYWKCRQQESIELETEPTAPLDWLDSHLFGRQGVYEGKLRRVFRSFALHEFRYQDSERSRWEIRMACRKHTSLLASIVLSTRNKAEYLERTLQSVCRQEVPFGFEVIVVDDGSTDDTQEVCRRFPVRYFHLENPRYRNPSVARNVGYRAARGDVIIAQSDDIIHLSPNTIEFLATDLKEGEFLLAKVDNVLYKDGKPHEWIMEYCGPKAHRPYFFLGAVSRKNLYAIGGSDEQFVEPCFDDNWFADCLTKGLGLVPRYTDAVSGHHQKHPHGKDTHQKEYLSKQLYQQKTAEAKRTGVYVASGGPWTEDGAKAKVPKQRRRVAPSSTRIPRRMAFFWSGSRMSWMRYLTVASFRHYNPDWNIVLYRSPVKAGKGWASSETQDSQTYHGPDYTPRLDSLGIEFVDWEPPVKEIAPAHACDLCQWTLLYEHGGWYADMDILWTDPMPEQQYGEADAVFCLSGGFMAIGLVGAAPQTRIMADIYAMARDNYSPRAYQSTGAEAVYRVAGVWPDWAKQNRPGDKAIIALTSAYGDLSVLELPSRTVYPWTYTHPDQIFSRSNDVPEGCVGIHWFGGNNLSQQWNDRLTEENFGQHDNTFSRYAAKMLCGG